MDKENEDKLRQEIVALRGEVKQLRDVVNLLLEMVMEHDGEEEFDSSLGDLRSDRNDRLQLGM